MVSVAMKKSSSPARQTGAAHTVTSAGCPPSCCHRETGSKAISSGLCSPGLFNLGYYAKLMFWCGKDFWSLEWGHFSSSGFVSAKSMCLVYHMGYNLCSWGKKKKKDRFHIDFNQKVNTAGQILCWFIPPQCNLLEVQ